MNKKKIAKSLIKKLQVLTTDENVTTITITNEEEQMLYDIVDKYGEEKKSE